MRYLRQSFRTFSLRCTTHNRLLECIYQPQWQRLSHQCHRYEISSLKRAQVCERNSCTRVAAVNIIIVAVAAVVVASPDFFFFFSVHAILLCYYLKTLRAVIHITRIRLLLLGLNFMVQIYTSNRVEHIYLFVACRDYCLFVLSFVLFHFSFGVVLSSCIIQNDAFIQAEEKVLEHDCTATKEKKIYKKNKSSIDPIPTA